MSGEIERGLDRERALRRLPVWAWYIRGARDMLLMMRRYNLCFEPRDKANKDGKDDRVIAKAILDMLLSDKLNIDRFLHDEYEIRLTDHEKDRKGKLVKCRAYFAKKVIRYEEV